MNIAERRASAATPRKDDVIGTARLDLDRRVTSVSNCNITYVVPAKNGGWWERNCLPITWARWCKKHGAFVARRERQ